MKKFFLIIFCLFVTALPTFAHSYNFNKGFVSDGGNLIGDYYTNVLNNVLFFLKKDTGTDLVVVTLDTKGKSSFKDIEREIFSRYKIGGENKDNWVMIIATATPYEINIRRGKKFRQDIPNTMLRAYALEFWMHKMSVNSDAAENNRARMQARYMYALVSSLAEVVADKYGKRVYYQEATELYGSEPLVQKQYFPQTDDFTKFLRKYNLTPAMILFFVGVVLPLYIRFAPRRRRYGSLSGLFRR